MADARTDLLKAVSSLSIADRARLTEAVETATLAHAGQTREDGTSYLDHVLAVGTILAEWGMNADAIIAGVLHDVLEDSELTSEELARRFGNAVASLVVGVTKFTNADFAGQKSRDRKVETLRKLFEVMRSDIRVAVIKLADRLHNVRTMESFSEQRRVKFGKETLDIYAKIAYHLGMNETRRELSERCVPFAYPDEYPQFAGLRERMLPTMKSLHADIQESLRQAGAQFHDLRLKQRSLISLHRYVLEDSLSDELAYYLVAVVEDQQACYALLPLLHTLYRPVSGRFRDFIAVPTESGYRSLHTTIVGPDGHLVELRIRTPEMDEEVQKGVLLYVGTGGEATAHFSWLERFGDLDRATRDSSEAFWEALQSDLFQEVVHVTVDGKSLSLPRGATALDAAYARHGRDAHETSAIEVNGAHHVLGYVLSDDDVVHVSIEQSVEVTFGWLGNVVTRYARSLIVDVLKERSREEKLAVGRQVVQKELDRERRGLLGEMTRGQTQKVARVYHRASFDDVLVMVGEGVLQPHDILVHLYPDAKRFPFFPWQASSYGFRIHLTGTHLRRQEILSAVSSLAGIYQAELFDTQLQYHEKDRTFSLSLKGRTPDRLHFADFLAALERQEWVSSVHTLLSPFQRALLLGSFLLASAVIIVDVVLLPHYQSFFGRYYTLPTFFIQILALLPIIGANYYLLQLLRHYVMRLRRDRWFFGLGFGLNILAFLLVVGRSIFANIAVPSLLPLIAIFVVSMMYLGYRFFQTELLFGRSSAKPVSPEEWNRLKRKKIAGYLIRFCAVIIWGILPLYMKYTPASSIQPFVRVFFISIGALLVSIPVLLGTMLLSSDWRKKLWIPKSALLASIIVSQGIYLYFASASLLLTTSTNFLLLNNFSPVFALLIAAVLWRQSIPYLKDPKHMVWIFLVFLMGSTGSSLIIYNTIHAPDASTLYGDMLGLAAMICDTLLVISQIRYVAHFPKANGASINVHLFSLVSLSMLPFILYLSLTGAPSITSLTWLSYLFGIGAGVILGAGQLLNYEAFKRIDGFIAFLMFNISILITFAVEVFLLHTFNPTWVLLLGGMTIIGSTVLAEIINSRCERKGL